MSVLLKGEKLRKTYENGKTVALDEVSLELPKGQFTAIMGPSGCGKSTLLFALSGADQVDSGQVYFDGEEISGMTEQKLADVRRLKMGFVFQQPTLLKNLNLMDNILLPAFGGQHWEEAKKEAEVWMDRCGIGGLGSRDSKEVSGGQLQRVGICRALINRPQMLFADEPTGALNSQTTEDIMKIFREIHADGTGILLVTHDSRVAASAERILFMKDGRLVADLMLGEYSEEEQEARGEKIRDEMSKLEI